MSAQGGNNDGTGAGAQRQGNQADQDNHANQCNPNHPSYEGHVPGYQGTGDKPDRVNHSNQLNPNNERYQGGKGGN